MDTATQERLISADDHVDLAQDSVKAHLASKYHGAYDAALREFAASMTNLRSVEANQRWREQQHLGSPQSPVGMGTGRTHIVFDAAGHRDAKARLADMDRDGIESSVTYCEVSAFRYLYLVRDGRKESTRAFNTALAEFASEDPDRLIVSSQIPIHDIDEAIAEVQWAAASGCKSLQLPVFPSELGLADYWDARYEPLFAAIQEAGLPICCHIGMNTMLDDVAQRDPTPQKGIFVPMVPLSAAESFGMWIMGGVFEKFPRLKVVFVEPGLGWVSWWLYTADDLATRQGYEFPAITELPSHYFRQNVFLTFVDEPDALEQARGRLGIENVMWSSDYPHPVTSFPNSRAIVDAMLADADPRERDLIRARQRGAGMESVTTRPAPRPTDDTAVYWDAVARHELVAQRCRVCGKLRHPPRPMCPHCRSLEWHEQRLAGTGSLYSYAVLHHPRSPLFEYPVLAALVDLDEGVRIVTNLVGIEPPDVRIGMRLTVDFEPTSEGGTVPVFRPDASAGEPA